MSLPQQMHTISSLSALGSDIIRAGQWHTKKMPPDYQTLLQSVERICMDMGHLWRSLGRQGSRL